MNPIMPASLGAAILPNGKRVELIDGRFRDKKKTTERNEREQQRAMKITEVIDKLRETMESDGWKCQRKSKYQILCRYVSLILFGRQWQYFFTMCILI